MAADLRRCGKSPVIWGTPAIAPPHFGGQPMARQRKAVRAMPCGLFEVVQKRFAWHENFSLGPRAEVGSGFGRHRSGA